MPTGDHAEFGVTDPPYLGSYCVNGVWYNTGDAVQREILAELKSIRVLLEKLTAKSLEPKSW